MSDITEYHHVKVVFVYMTVNDTQQGRNHITYIEGGGAEVTV